MTAPLAWPVETGHRRLGALVNRVEKALRPIELGLRYRRSHPRSIPVQKNLPLSVRTMRMTLLSLAAPEKIEARSSIMAVVRALPLRGRLMVILRFAPD